MSDEDKPTNPGGPRSEPKSEPKALAKGSGADQSHRDTIDISDVNAFVNALGAVLQGAIEPVAAAEREKAITDRRVSDNDLEGMKAVLGHEERQESRAQVRWMVTFMPSAVLVAAVVYQAIKMIGEGNTAVGVPLLTSTLSAALAFAAGFGLGRRGTQSDREDRGGAEG